MKFTIRIPTAQYAYLEAEFTGEAEEAIAEHNRLLELYNASQKAQNTPNLQPIPFLRLLHKYMVENRLEMEDVESLGTDKLYSQKDVVSLIKNVFAKITREANGGRINKEEDIRYVSETYTNHYNDLKRE